MKNYRLVFGKWDKNLELKVIFTQIIKCKSMRGAIRKARNLEPLEWDSRNIISLDDERNLFIDKLEFNY